MISSRMQGVLGHDSMVEHVMRGTWQNNGKRCGGAIVSEHHVVAYVSRLLCLAFQKPRRRQEQLLLQLSQP